jgi:hypothetical protein
MSDYWTDPNPEGINRTLRDLLNFQYGVSDTVRGVGTGLAGIANIPGQFFSGKTPSAPNFTPGFTPRPWQMTPPTNTRNQRGTGPTLGPDGTPLIKTGAFTGRNTENDVPPLDPLAQMEYDLLMQIASGANTGGRSVDLSGYNASLKMLGKERKRMKARYKKYENQIADIYGTLTGINTSMIADILPTGEAMRADLSAQEGQQAAATRSADAARLAAATKARAELGLEDVASQYAGGDVATTQAEGMIADSAANKTAAENTLLANEAIAKQQLTNQNLGRTIQQESSTANLQRSLEDALSAIRAERANVLMQRSQAASQASGGGPDYGARLDAIQGLRNMGQGPEATDVVGRFLQANPTLEPVAAPLLNSFNSFITGPAYTRLKNIYGTSPIPALAAINAFKDSTPQAQVGIDQNPILSNLLTDWYNRFGKSPKVE